MTASLLQVSWRRLSIDFRNAWSKSRLWYGPASRCEQILDRMVGLCVDRPELQPDRTSFNTVIDTLAKSRESDRERRAEDLLEQMEELSSGELALDCSPDQVVSTTDRNLL